MGEKETPECGVGKAGSGAVISLGKLKVVQFRNEHRNTFKIRKKKQVWVKDLVNVAIRV